MHRFNHIKSKGISLLESYGKNLEYNLQEKVANYGAHVSMNFLLFGISLLMLVFFYLAVAFGVGSMLNSYALGFLVVMCLICLQLMIVYSYRFSIIKKMKKALIGINFDESTEEGIVENVEQFYKKRHTLELSITKQQHELEKEVQEILKVNSILSSFLSNQNTNNASTQVSAGTLLKDGLTVIGKTQSIIHFLRDTFKPKPNESR